MLLQSPQGQQFLKFQVHILINFRCLDGHARDHFLSHVLAKKLGGNLSRHFFPTTVKLVFVRIGGDNPLNKNCGASYTAQVRANHVRNSGRELATSDLNVSMEPNVF